MLHTSSKSGVSIVASVATLLLSAGSALAVTLPPVPAGSDAILYKNVVTTIPEGGASGELFTSTIPTTSANGVGVALVTGKTVSDYIFADNGFIAFYSSEGSAPVLPVGISSANFKKLKETGGWQKVNQDLGVTRRLYVASVPEPATWAFMLIGGGFAGAALRRRRDRLARA